MFLTAVGCGVEKQKQNKSRWCVKARKTEQCLPFEVQMHVFAVVPEVQLKTVNIRPKMCRQTQ